jgi:hypothetical protein
MNLYWGIIWRMTFSIGIQGAILGMFWGVLIKGLILQSRSVIAGILYGIDIGGGIGLTAGFCIGLLTVVAKIFDKQIPPPNRVGIVQYLIGMGLTIVTAIGILFVLGEFLQVGNLTSIPTFLAFVAIIQASHTYFNKFITENLGGKSKKKKKKHPEILFYAKSKNYGG